MSRPTHTRTFVTLEIDPQVWDEIAERLRDAGYDHAFVLEGRGLDLHNIALTKRSDP